MSVAASTHAQVVFAHTTNSLTSLNVGGANPVIAGIMALSSATLNVTSATWSLGGTATQISSTRTAGPGNLLLSAWVVKAPTTGNGTLRFGFDGAVDSNGIIASYTGAHQTTPMNAVDTVTSLSVSSNIVLTPSNLTANDATLFLGSNVLNGNWSSTTPSQWAIDNTHAVGILAGGATGVTGVHEWNDAGMVSNDEVMMSVRIIAAAAGGTAFRMISPAPLSVGSGNRFFGNSRLG